MSKETQIGGTSVLIKVCHGQKVHHREEVQIVKSFVINFNSSWPRYDPNEHVVTPESRYCSESPYPRSPSLLGRLYAFSTVRISHSSYYTSIITVVNTKELRYCAQQVTRWSC